MSLHLVARLAGKAWRPERQDRRISHGPGPTSGRNADSRRLCAAASKPRARLGRPGGSAPHREPAAGVERQAGSIRAGVCKSGADVGQLGRHHPHGIAAAAIELGRPVLGGPRRLARRHDRGRQRASAGTSALAARLAVGSAGNWKSSRSVPAPCLQPMPACWRAGGPPRTTITSMNCNRSSHVAMSSPTASSCWTRRSTAAQARRPVST